MGRSGLLLVLLGAGCGRLSFNPLAAGGGDSDGGDSASTCAAAWFCDGYERGLPGPWNNGVSADVSLVMSPVHSGTYALRAMPPSTGTAVTGWSGFNALTSGDIYMRAYYYFPGTWSIEHVDIAGLSAINAPATVVLEGINGQPAVWTIASSTIYASTPLPRDTWFCLEMHVAVSANGTIDVWMNDAPVASMSGFDSRALGGTGYDVISQGVNWSPSTQAAPTVYVDDVVVSPNRIGC